MKETDEKKKLSPLIISTVMKAWSTPETSSIVVDTRLAEAFAEILDDIWSKPWLGNATTRELIDELSARIDLDYKTTG